ncbi:MAG: acetate kinase [Bacteroidetes bacterium]|nr:acetate kinase [Bacteroidota bacterium]MBU1578844.1 acetate kinase [Bacteroidota bacterium]MBU2558452.1 acetate kinase [Bacteroidota bacterium]
MKIIVLNCGSSSIKYQLFEMPSKAVLAKGLVDKIGLKGSLIKHKRTDGVEAKLEGEILDHQAGIQFLLGILVSEKYGSIKNIEEIDAVGHRVVHAGEKFSGSVFITEEVIDALEECVDLAPLHNPPNLKGIYAMKELLPEVPQVGVFDTAFHQTMPPKAYLYGIPYSLYEKYKIRRYGFHGTSHKYVSRRACEILGLDYDQQKIITCHLGNGASMAAISNGKSVDTSMGMTPIEGLIMGTRCGDLDVGALLYIADKEETSIQNTSTLVNKFSGMIGISGVSSDMRDIEIAAENGNERAQVAMEMYQYRVRKYIGAYAAAMGGVDVIVFAGGIGENDTITRTKSLDGLEFLGVDVDREKSLKSRGKEEVISTAESRVKVIVVPTDEELMIAADTYEIVETIVDSQRY